ncbi:hypothetical protein Misp02_58080 [Microtetraspora sp. NBRC 16547]|nr:hypothetical protein Misp02_58080 [Microtetraspora sp. NBRC 16547]
MSEYSGTPLPRKLGIKPGHRVLTTNTPSDLGIEGDEGPEPHGVIVGPSLRLPAGRSVNPLHESARDAMFRRPCRQFIGGSSPNRTTYPYMPNL